MKPVLSPNEDTIDQEKIAREESQILEEIVIEELSIDGICGVY